MCLKTKWKIKKDSLSVEVQERFQENECNDNQKKRLKLLKGEGVNDKAMKALIEESFFLREEDY